MKVGRIKRLFVQPPAAPTKVTVRLNILSTALQYYYSITNSNFVNLIEIYFIIIFRLYIVEI